MVQDIEDDEAEKFIEKPKSKHLKMHLHSTNQRIRQAGVGILCFGLILILVQLSIAVTKNKRRKTIVPLKESLAFANVGSKKLEYVHITETGGEFLIWTAFNSQGILWGSCHFIPDPTVGCNSPDLPNHENYEEYAGRSPWHQPPYILHPDFNPYKHAALFTVVRNPYCRIVAEYYDPWFGNKSQDRDDPRVMNEFLQNQLAEEFSSFKIQSHYIPQVEYVFDESGKQIIDHVLRYENVGMEFEMLSEKYDLKILLDWSLTPRDDVTFNKLNPGDLSPETIQMINEYAKEDFEVFGYEMVKDASDIVY